MVINEKSFEMGSKNPSNNFEYDNIVLNGIRFGVSYGEGLIKIIRH
jgi:hypothetical protein